ncbi:hypothetical protein ACJJTC_001210 [Scirpophaga incertulas]
MNSSALCTDVRRTISEHQAKNGGLTRTRRRPPGSACSRQLFCCFGAEYMRKIPCTFFIKTMFKVGDLYKDLFAEYKKGKKPSIAQKEFNELWANAKQKNSTKEEFVKWANDLLADYRRKHQTKKSSNILYYCSNSKKMRIFSQKRIIIVVYAFYATRCKLVCTSHSKQRGGGRRGAPVAPQRGCRSLGRSLSHSVSSSCAIAKVGLRFIECHHGTGERARIGAVGWIRVKMSSSTKRPRYVCTFTDTLKQRFPIMKDGREPTEVFCSICNNHFSIKFKGGADIEKHILTEKHKKNSLTVSSNTKIDSLFQPQSSGLTDQISAAEATLAFHTVKHHQSFKSMDCTSQLVKAIFADSNTAKSISCARTKTEAIVTGVISPWVIEQVQVSLQNVNFLGVSTDASNHGAEKIFPIMIQFFDWQEGIKTKLLDTKIEDIEKENNSVLDIKRILESTHEILVARANANFMPLKVRELLAKCTAENQEVFKHDLKNMYKTCVEYLIKWMTPLDDFKVFNWLMLKKGQMIDFDQIALSIHYLNGKGIHIDDVKLFDEIASLNSFLTKQEEAFFDVMLHALWANIFKTIGISRLPEILRICQYIFAITAQNANVERVFSIMGAQWSKERNRLNVSSIRALLLVQYNLKSLTCEAFYKSIIKEKNLLKKVSSNIKYDKTN